MEATTRPKLTEDASRFLRLPKTGEREPLTGLSRSYLNALILPTRANNFSPPVRSYVLKKPGARTGVRLIDRQSLIDYVCAREETRSQEDCNEQL
jgi:hypothetical protein